MFPKFMNYLFFFGMFLIIAAMPGNAVSLNSIVSDVRGMLTDPIKLDSSSEKMLHAVERAAILGDKIERNARNIAADVDERVKNRIEQIDKIVAETRKEIREGIADIDVVIDDALAEVHELETKIFADANLFVKCTLVTTEFQMQQAIANALNQLGKRKPRLVIFGWTAITAEIEPSDILEPLDSFMEIKAEYEAQWQQLSLSDHPDKLTNGYAAIQRIADLTRCHYKQDTGAAEKLLFWELEMNRRERAWRFGVVNNI